MEITYFVCIVDVEFSGFSVWKFLIYEIYSSVIFYMIFLFNNLSINYRSLFPMQTLQHGVNVELARTPKEHNVKTRTKIDNNRTINKFCT